MTISSPWLAGVSLPSPTPGSRYEERRAMFEATLRRVGTDAATFAAAS